MEKIKLSEALKEAHEAGNNDTNASDHLSENALLFLDKFGEVTDDEHDQIIEAYISGFTYNPAHASQLEEIKEVLFRLMDIAEDCYPKYYRCTNIAIANDLIKKIWG